MMWTESQVIDAIRQEFPERPEIAPLGIGDDCAQMRTGLELVTTDASVEGVHFDLAWMTLADAAYRCLASNLSDVAAMGAENTAFTLALCLRTDLAFDEIRSAAAALRQCLADHGIEDRCALIGGDVVRSPAVMFSITMFGQTPPWPIATRAGARPGDRIAVLGNLGYAAAGLEIFTQNRQNDPECAEFSRFIDAFRRPHAQTALGPALGRAGAVSAMMDTSDGIMTDLPRLCAQSRCGAQIELETFEPSDKLAALGSLLGKDPRRWMTCGGEDFGLLVTIPEFRDIQVRRIAADCGVQCRFIGKCTAEPGRVRWTDHGRPIVPENVSFVHFS